MTIINGQMLLDAAPIKNMLTTKEKFHGVSHGLAELGYDIRIKQEVFFTPTQRNMTVQIVDGRKEAHLKGRFTLASAIEEFQMPPNLGAEVKDKSTWARRGLSVFNTVVEPGFCGGLTLELVYHGRDYLHIPAGVGIAQVLFYQTALPAYYRGKYQGQSTDPVEAILE